MLQKVSQIAEQTATNVSRRQFLGRLIDTRFQSVRCRPGR